MDSRGQQQKKRQQQAPPATSAYRPQNSSLPSASTVVAMAAAAYGTYQLANWAWQQWKQHDEQQHATRQQQSAFSFFGGASPPAEKTVQIPWRLRRQLLTQCRDDTVKALTGFLPTLHRSIEGETGDRMSRARKKLKLIRAERGGPNYQVEQERELWDQVKLCAFTQLIAMAYGNSLLFVALTVQVNLLGGYSARQQQGGNDEEQRQACHRFVLSHTYQHFFNNSNGCGMQSLMRTVERAVSEVVGDWNVLEPEYLRMTRESIDQAIAEIRMIVEDDNTNKNGLSRRHRRRNLMRFLMPASAWGVEDAAEASQETGLTQQLLDETWDLCESPLVADALQECLDVTFATLRDSHWGLLFDASGDAVLCEDSAAALLEPEKPLATILTKLSKSSKNFCNPQDHSHYVTSLQGLPPVLELADVSFN